jgi:hypothetical protein
VSEKIQYSENIRERCTVRLEARHVPRASAVSIVQEAEECHPSPLWNAHEFTWQEEDTLFLVVARLANQWTNKQIMEMQTVMEWFAADAGIIKRRLGEKVEGEVK